MNMHIFYEYIWKSVYCVIWNGWVKKSFLSSTWYICCSKSV